MDLFVLRHAKSSWEEDGTPDHDRPLAPRGERAAGLMGAFMAQQALEPSLVLCSSARRARETLDRVVPQLAAKPEVEIESELYLASTGELLSRIQRVEPSWTRVLLVGHNPGMGDLARLLAGRGDPAALRRLTAKFPTAGLAALRFAGGTWEETAPGSGELRIFSIPKDLV